MVNLTDDCLRMIFEYLPIVDRIETAKVCKRWEKLSKLFWSNFKKLDLCIETWTSEYSPRVIVLNTSNTLEKVLKLSGKYLTCINFPASFIEKREIELILSHRDIENICNECPNIQELVLLSIDMEESAFFTKFDWVEQLRQNKPKIVPYLKPHCKRLTKLGINLNSYGDSEEELAELFEEMENLKSIQLDKSPWHFDTNCLLSLPLGRLEQFILYITSIKGTETWRLFNLMISKCVNLHTLYLHGLDTECINMDFFSQMNLKSFTLRSPYIYSQVIPSKAKIRSCILQWDLLETLCLKYQEFVDDEFLKVLCVNCKQITKLNIQYSHDVTDAGISTISSLKRLRDLNVSHLGKLALPLWGKMDNLEKLNISGNLELQPESMCDLLHKAPNLKILNVSNCCLIDETLSTTALLVVKARSVNSVLNIVAYDTKIRARSMKRQIRELKIFAECKDECSVIQIA